VETLVRELGVSNDVIFLGKIKAIEKVLCMSDLFVLTSESESFGLSALEAMATGVPVISTNTGGIPEVNHQGVSGFLSNVGNIDEMAQNALRILTNDDLMAELQKGALARAAEFNQDRILPMYEALYEKTLQQSLATS
jgi:glycosyltransferase involved in cell wall biosynthesis